MAIADVLESTSVSELDLSRYVAVPGTASVAETVTSMCDARQSCACIVNGEELLGIFTQRDVLMRVLGRSRIWELPITEEMTRPVKTLRDHESVADGLAIMSDWWVRSVPVLSGEDRLVGNLSWHTVMRTIAELVAGSASERSSEPGVEQALAFIDFTGLSTSTPVTVIPDETVDVAVHHMRARAIGSVLVVDDRHHLVGILTEFDLQTKLGCERADLTAVTVGEIMTPNPVTLSARSPIVDAIAQMAERNFAHAPLMGESDRPVGIASFRDIAAYFEASLESFG